MIEVVFDDLPSAEDYSFDALRREKIAEQLVESVNWQYDAGISTSSIGTEFERVA